MGEQGKGQNRRQGHEPNKVQGQKQVGAQDKKKTAKQSKKQDLRVIKSKRAIANAFWKLMEEGGFSNVNVRKVIELAEVNRSTFYAHYQDKYDLMDKLGDELLEGIVDITKQAPVDSLSNQKGSDEAFRSYLTSMLAYIESQGDHFALLAGKDGDPSFGTKISHAVMGVWRDFGLEGMFTVPENYLLTAVSGMMSGLISEWAANGFEGGAEKFSDVVFRLISPLVFSVIDVR